MFKFIKMLRCRNKFGMTLIKIWERIKKMIYKGSNAVEDVYVGGDQISEVYHGSDLVYSSSKIKYASMSYVTGHIDGTNPSGFADGSGAQTAIKCLCLVRKDGAAKAIPFALYNDTITLAPTDEQVEAAEWVAGNYSAAYNSGYFNTYSSTVGPLNKWIPAVAQDPGNMLAWDIPQIASIRAVTNGVLEAWGWPIYKDGNPSNEIDSAYTITVKGGACYIYYNGNLVKKIRAK